MLAMMKARKKLLQSGETAKKKKEQQEIAAAQASRNKSMSVLLSLQQVNNVGATPKKSPVPSPKEKAASQGRGRAKTKQNTGLDHVSSPGSKTLRTWGWAAVASSGIGGKTGVKVTNRPPARLGQNLTHT